MSVLVSVKSDNQEQWLPHFAAALPGEAHVWDTHDGDTSVLAEVDYAMVWGPQASLFKRIPNVRAIFSLGAGVDHILNAGTVPAHLPVVRYVGGDLTARMAEYVAWQCLLHLRRHADYQVQQAAGQWQQLAQLAACEVRVGIMGLGVMGAHSAAVLKAIGFQVSGWSRSPKQIMGVETFSGAESLDSFLAGTDILVCLLPHTPQTQHLISRAFLKKLKRNGVLGGPILINAGRGKCQIDADVLAALTDGTLKAASLDVFEAEPLPPASPFWALQNCFITPHAAAWSDRRAVVAYAAAQIKNHRAGLPLQNVVDRQRGY
jgi:glyoxylate/hydroxypyruvate reductase A